MLPNNAIHPNNQYILSIFSNIHYLRGAKGEDALANEVTIKLRNLSLDGKLNGVWSHVPNEYVIKNNIDRARVRKRQCIGMIPGAPDLVLYNKNGGLGIELKTETGRLSDNQKSFKQWADDNNAPYVVARSWNDVESALVKYGFIDPNYPEFPDSYHF